MTSGNGDPRVDRRLGLEGSEREAGRSARRKNPFKQSGNVKSTTLQNLRIQGKGYAREGLRKSFFELSKNSRKGRGHNNEGNQKKQNQYPGLNCKTKGNSAILKEGGGKSRAIMPRAAGNGQEKEASPWARRTASGLCLGQEKSINGKGERRLTPNDEGKGCSWGGAAPSRSLRKKTQERRPLEPTSN